MDDSQSRGRARGTTQNAVVGLSCNRLLLISHSIPLDHLVRARRGMNSGGSDSRTPAPSQVDADPFRTSLSGSRMACPAASVPLRLTAAGRLRRIYDSFCRKLPLGLVRDVRPQYLGTCHPMRVRRLPGRRHARHRPTAALCWREGDSRPRAVSQRVGFETRKQPLRCGAIEASSSSTSSSQCCWATVLRSRRTVAADTAETRAQVKAADAC